MTRVDALPVLLLVAAAALALCHTGGALARRFRQPAILGELTAGVVVAAVVIRLAGWTGDLWGARPDFHLLGQVGLVAFAILIASELPAGRRGVPRGTVSVLLAGTLLPAAALGAVVAIVGRSTLLGPTAGPAGIAFLAAGAGVTALPVLARMVEDLGLRGTNMATLAVATAAACDAVLWCVLAVTLGVGSGIAPTAARLGCLALIVLLSERVLRPLLSDLRRPGSVGLPVIGIPVLAAVGAACATYNLGLSAPLGGFIVGLSLRGETAIGRVLAARARTFVTAVLLPIAFVDTSLLIATLRIASPATGLVLIGVVIALVAVKWAGSRIATRVVGLDRSSAGITAALLSGRGVTELVVAAIGLHAGLLTPSGVAVLVGAAVLSTALTSVLARPALRTLRTAMPISPNVATLGDPIEEPHAA